MRWIYLSPHLDDAVLSAGGLIHEQTRTGMPVEIWTFMCGVAREDDVSPFAQALHTLWGFSSAQETTEMRRKEDRRAAARLGAMPVHFDFLDCIYRRGPNGDWLYSDVFVPLHPEDEALPGQIADAISARLEAEDVLVCQLSVGSHVDHVLVRKAAELLGRPLLYDIDVPYIFLKPGQLLPKSAGMKESVHPVTENGLNAWKEAALMYKSQIPSLGDAFETPEKAQASIQAYWAQVGGIRLLQLR